MAGRDRIYRVPFPFLHCLGGRVLRPEILDGVRLDQARDSLADIVRLNRYFGGHSVLRRILPEVIGSQETFTVLDVGAASGDMGDCIRSLYPGATVTSLDYLAFHMAKAAPPKVCADAFHLPFRDRSFDIVFCSLFLHHFTNEEIVNLLRGFQNVARSAIVVIDLERNPLSYYFVPLSRWLLRWDPITVHDAPASVEAGFHATELRELAVAAGLANPRVRPWKRSFRVTLVTGAD